MSDDIVSLEHREAQVAELEAEIERLRVLLDRARIILKGRDQRPDEMALYNDIRAALEGKP